MNIYEDIFANGLSGFIVLVDALNLSRYLQITGREKLKITFATPGEDTQNTFLTKEFIIYKVASEVKMQGDGSTLIRLEFVFPTVYQNSQL